MNDTRRFAFLAVTTMMTVVLPCVAQEQQSSQATPDLSGTGNAGRIAVWKNSTTLGSSVISQSSGSVGIGTATPAATLEVNGNAQIDGDFSLSGSILENGVGQLLWAGNIGGGNLSVGLEALPSSALGAGNTAVGDNALGAVTTGGPNSAVGNFALMSNTSGQYNVALSYASLYSNATGFGNTGIGFDSLNMNIGGAFNIAVGMNSLLSNNSGNYNTAVGVDTLTFNTSGSSNTAIGHYVLNGNTTGGGNTAIGEDALEYNSTGSENTAIGILALDDNTAGNNNSAIGYGALSQNTTGSNNIAIGYAAGTFVGGSNNILIGHKGTATDNGTIRIGCTTGCSGNPPQTSTFIAGIYGATTSLSSTMPVIIDANGNLGTMQSSRRYKADIHDMGEASDGLMQLRPVTFRYKKAYDDGSKPVQYGLIAEEVAEVYPGLVARSADGQVESVRYQLLDPMLLNALQKQHATIDAQKKQIQSLEERLARVEAMLAAGATGAAGQ